MLVLSDSSSCRFSRASLQQTSALMELSIPLSAGALFTETCWQRPKRADTIFHVSALKVFRGSPSQAAISMLNNNQGYSELKTAALAANHQLRSARGDDFSISPEERHLSARFPANEKHRAWNGEAGVKGTCLKQQLRNQWHSDSTFTLHLIFLKQHLYALIYICLKHTLNRVARSA